MKLEPSGRLFASQVRCRVGPSKSVSVPERTGTERIRVRRQVLQGLWSPVRDGERGSAQSLEGGENWSDSFQRKQCFLRSSHGLQLVRNEAMKEITCVVDLQGFCDPRSISRNCSSTHTYICSGSSYVVVFVLSLG